VASDPARDRALAKAAEIRAVRAEVVAAVADATTTLDQVFDRSAGEPMVADIKILTVLESVPDVGKVRARRILEATGIAESQRIDELDRDARVRLLAELER
jgi:hypothetical protein